MRSRLYVVAVLAALAATPSRAATIRVAVVGLAFVPARITAHVGDTIEWTNADFVAHTATARNKEWDVTIPAKASGSVVLGAAGEIDYFCRFHPTMVGHLAVIK